MDIFEGIKTGVLSLSTNGIRQILVASALFALGVLWKVLKERLEGKIKKHLESLHNCILIAFFGLPLLGFLLFELWYAAAAAAIMVILYLILRHRLEAIHYGLGVALAVQFSASVLAYILNARYLDAQGSQYDVAFVLAPKGYPEKEKSSEIHKNLHDALRATFKGVSRVHIAPESPSQEELKKYPEEDSLLKYRTKERSIVRVAFKNSYDIVRRAPGFNMIISLTVFSRSDKPGGFQVDTRWAPNTFRGTESELDWISLHESYRLASFLFDNGFIKLDPSDKNKVWSNVLREYKEFLFRHNDVDSNRKLYAEVESILGEPSRITPAEPGRLLLRYQTAFIGEAFEASFNQEVRAVKMRMGLLGPDA